MGGHAGVNAPEGEGVRVEVDRDGVVVLALVRPEVRERGRSREVFAQQAGIVPVHGAEERDEVGRALHAEFVEIVGREFTRNGGIGRGGVCHCGLLRLSAME